MQAAREAIDKVHRQDPLFQSGSAGAVAGTGAQNELQYADAMEAWARKVLDAHKKSATASGTAIPVELQDEDLLLLASRCQHLERFATPRSTFPDGKAGYLQWRRSLYTKQADKAKAILISSGVSDESADRVHKWVRKGELNVGKESGDPGEPANAVNFSAAARALTLVTLQVHSCSRMRQCSSLSTVSSKTLRKSTKSTRTRRCWTS